jgi:hypothetical protein
MLETVHFDNVATSILGFTEGTSRNVRRKAAAATHHVGTLFV